MFDWMKKKKKLVTPDYEAEIIGNEARLEWAIEDDRKGRLTRQAINLARLQSRNEEQRH